MDFSFDERTAELHEKLTDFMAEYVYPAEAVFEEQLAVQTDPWSRPPVIEYLKHRAEAKRKDR